MSDLTEEEYGSYYGFKSMNADTLEWYAAKKEVVHYNNIQINNSGEGILLLYLRDVNDLM